ncbi:MAG: DinB family protein [Bacteroidota bacterium]
MMSSKELWIHRFQYNRDANRRFIKVIAEHENIPAPVIKLFSHICNTHLVWLDRVHTLKNETIPDIWEIHKPGVFPSLNTRCFELTEWFVQAENYGLPFARVIRYQNSKKRVFENTIQEIYSHILMHSMYHRGQMAKYLREKGIEPPITDFIMMNREELSPDIGAQV